MVWWEHCGDQSQEALVVRRVIFAVSCAVSCRTRSTFCSAAAMLSAAAALLDPVSHSIRTSLTLSSHSLSQVRGARTFELLARHPWYHAIVRRRRTPYVHRISMVALPVCFLFRQANGTKVHLKSSPRHTVGLASSPQVGILAFGDVAFRILPIVLIGGLQGA